MPSRVIGSTSPAASPTSIQPAPAGASAAERAGASATESASCSARGRRPRRVLVNPPPGAVEKRGRVRLVRLRAHPDREVIRPRKRPEVAGRLVLERDVDVVATIAVRRNIRWRPTGRRVRTAGPPAGEPGCSRRRRRLSSRRDCACAWLRSPSGPRTASRPCDALGRCSRPGGYRRRQQRSVEIRGGQSRPAGCPAGRCGQVRRGAVRSPCCENGAGDPRPRRARVDRALARPVPARGP